MSINLKTFSSAGGFSIDNVTVVNENKELKNIHTYELKNSFFSDANIIRYILKGANTTVLSLDDINSTIPIASETINFISANIVATNPSNTGIYSLKLEYVVRCDSAGSSQTLSGLTTVIREQIPTGEDWNVDLYTIGSPNRISFSTSVAGNSAPVKWISCVEVTSVLWS